MDLKSSRSIHGYHFPDFEMLDAKIASALNKIIQNSYFKHKVSLEQQKAQLQDRFLRGRQTSFMIYEYFRVTGAHDTVLDYADLFSITLRTGKALPRAESFGDLIAADHKVLSEGCESRNITDTQSWYKIWQLNRFKRIRASRNSSSRQRSQKSFILRIPGNSAKLVNYPERSGSENIRLNTGSS